MQKGIPQPCTDHEGNKFPSISALCRHWDTNTTTYKNRIAKGWTKEQALTTPTKMKHTDHKGNKFRNKIAMCGHYGISVTTFDARINDGMTKEQALTTPTKTKPEPKSKPKPCTDSIGNTFENVEKMCNYYNISKYKYDYRINHKYSQLEALGIIPLLNNRTKNAKITDTITVIKFANIDDKRKFFLCLINNSSEAILSRNTILKYAIKYHTAKAAKTTAIL